MCKESDAKTEYNINLNTRVSIKLLYAFIQSRTVLKADLFVFVCKSYQHWHFKKANCIQISFFF